MENKITQTFKNNKLLSNIDNSKLNFKDIKGKLVTLKEGEILFREGETSEFIFLIVSGEIKVYERNENEITKSLVLSEGEFFGHLDFYETSTRTTNAVGVKDSYLIAVSKAEMNNLLWQDVNILQNLKNLCSFKAEESNNLANNIEEINKQEFSAVLPENEIVEDSILKLNDDTYDFEQDIKKSENNELDFIDINNNFNIENSFDTLNNSAFSDIEKDLDVLSNEINDDINLIDNIPLSDEEPSVLENIIDLEQQDTSDLLEFVDDEEPENIEFKFSEDLFLNQFNSSNPIDNFLESDDNTQKNKDNLDEFNLESFVIEQNENSNLEDAKNFIDEIDNTELNNYPKENGIDLIDELPEQVDIKEVDNEGSILDSYLSQFNDNDIEKLSSETDIAAMKFEEDDIIKPEGDIEELEELENFNKEQFLKSEFEETYTADKEERDYSNFEMNFEIQENKGNTSLSSDDLIDKIFENAEEQVNNSITEEIPIKNEPEPVVESESVKTNNGAVMNIDQLKMILKAAQLVSSKIKLDDVLQNIVSVATNLTNCDRGTLYLVDKEREEIWSKIAMGNELKEIRLKIGDGIAGWVAKTGEIVNITDVQTDSRFKSSFDKSSGYQTKSMICFPIKNVEGEIIGVHQLLNSRNGKFSEMDVEFLNAISIHASIALENAELVEKLLQFERISSLGKMANFLIQDIKNPVLISKKYTEHLKSKNLPQDASRILDMILEQLNQVADLVLTTSNYSEKNKVLRQINTNIISVLNDYTSRIESLVKKKNCTIVNHFDVDALIRVDLKEFYQAYQHIVKNAAESMPDGGTINISTVKEDNFIKILIKDTGLGIADSIKDKIFDPFMTHGKKEGTGLGLSISKKIISEHSGSIDFESSLGQGSTFVIKLPIAQDF